MTRSWLIVATLGSLAAPVAVGAQASSLPHLVPVFTSSDVDASPADRMLTPIRVGPQGQMLFVTNTSPTARLLLLDSTGKVMARFGHPGAGPGEFQGPRPVDVTRDGVVVWDNENHRVSEWSLDGKLKRELRIMDAGEPKDATSTDLISVRYAAGAFKPIAINRAAGVPRELLLPADSFYVNHLVAVDRIKAVRYPGIPGLWENGFIVGDANTYRLALYKWDGTLVRVLGRDLPPIHASAARTDEFIAQTARKTGRKVADFAPMRAQAMAEQLPYFDPQTSLRTDGLHRIWVLGMEGDSAFADLFTSERFIGRLHLPCHFFNGVWSVSGSWLALACVPDDPNASVDAVVKLFRIAEAK